MAVRLMTYVGLLYEGLIRSRQLPLTGELPPVVPIVLYNGRDRWTAAQDMARLVAEAPGGLAVYRPQLRYVLIDAGRNPESALAPLRNLVAALFRLENSRTPEDVQRVLAGLVVWLGDPAQDSLRRAFTIWLRRVLLPARLPTVSMPEVHDLLEVQSMLAERVIEWTEAWKAEGLGQGRQEGLQQGLQQGRQEGLAEGLAAERALLLRQTPRRFGEACAQALAPLLEGQDNPEQLAEIGEWIITADTAEVFLTRVLTA